MNDFVCYGYYEEISYEIEYVRGILCELYDKRYKDDSLEKYQHKLNRILKYAEKKANKAKTIWEKHRWTDVVVLEAKSLLDSSFDDYYTIDSVMEDEIVHYY